MFAWLSSWPNSTSNTARQDVVDRFGQPDLLGFRNQKTKVGLAIGAFN